jgi:hypothetical protein
MLKKGNAMKRTLAAAATAASLMSAGSALASPKDDMCELISILTKDGVEAAMAFTESLADVWPAEQRAKLGVVVGSDLEKFTYRGGQLYQTADLPGTIEEYFITLNLVGAGSVYLRVLYEGNGQELNFINIDFKSSYYDALEKPFLQAPQPVSCS